MTMKRFVLSIAFATVIVAVALAGGISIAFLVAFVEGTVTEQAHRLDLQRNGRAFAGLVFLLWFSIVALLNIGTIPDRQYSAGNPR